MLCKLLLQVKTLIYSESHATLKKSLEFSSSFLCFSLIYCYSLLYITFNSEYVSSIAFYSILRPLEPTTQMCRLTLNGFLVSRHILLGCFRGVSPFPYSFITVNLAGQNLPEGSVWLLIITTPYNYPLTLWLRSPTLHNYLRNGQP